MDTKRLKNILAKGDDPILLIDVREEKEALDEPYFEIPPENYLLIPLPILSVLSEEELARKVALVSGRLNREGSDVRIVTLCHSGRRLEAAATYFSRLGFSAESLDGGHEAWILHRD